MLFAKFFVFLAADAVLVGTAEVDASAGPDVGELLQGLHETLQQKLAAPEEMLEMLANGDIHEVAASLAANPLMIELARQDPEVASVLNSPEKLEAQLGAMQEALNDPDHREVAIEMMESVGRVAAGVLLDPDFQVELQAQAEPLAEQTSLIDLSPGGLLGHASAFQAAPTLRTPSAAVAAAPAVAAPALAAARVARAAQPQAMAAAVAELPKVGDVSKVQKYAMGAYFGSVLTGVLVAIYPMVMSCALWSVAFDKERRRAMDFIVALWARLSMIACFAKVKVNGVENLPPPGEAVMYVPNHSSFLDIYVLSAFLPRRFKYISKVEILRIPLIGWAMSWAKHIAIRRMDRASQIQTLKDAVDTLKAGNSLVTFPEGTRSKDGRVIDFKKGPFTMAARAGVRVVPISIVGTHPYMPAADFAPRALPRGITITVHPPLDAPPVKQEDATLQAAREAVLSALPEEMQPEK